MTLFVVDGVNVTAATSGRGPKAHERPTLLPAAVTVPAPAGLWSALHTAAARIEAAAGPLRRS